MKNNSLKLIMVLTLFIPVYTAHANTCSNLLDFNVRTLNEKTQLKLCEEYQGKVILIVNTASRCAYTDQYDSLEKLYSQYKEQGLVVLGFPSNDFGQQEPGNETQIKEFCRLTYGVEFPMFEKTHAGKSNAHPMFQALANAAGRYPSWNFHKYLIARNGELVKDYASSIDPLNKNLVKEIRAQLKVD